MIGKNSDGDDTDFDDVDDESVEDLLDDDDTSDDDDDDDDVMPDIGGDTLVDISAEINVEELVAMLEASSDPDEAAHRRAVRKRLEELREQKDSDLDSTFNFNLDDDV